MARDLAEIAIGLTRRLAEDGEAGADAKLAFSRAARAARLALALEAKLDEDRQSVDEAALARAEAQAAETARAQGQAGLRVLMREAEVLVHIEQAIEDEAPEGEVGPLFERLYERLADEREDLDFVGRPLGEVIAAIRADLGLPVDPALLTDPLWLETGGDWEPPEGAVSAPVVGSGGLDGPWFLPRIAGRARPAKAAATRRRVRRPSG